MANNTNLSFPSAFCQQFFDENGKPLSSGKLYTYIAGSSTPVVTYKTISGGTESANMNTNPIILDMAGMADLVISKDTAYKFVLFDKNNVKKYTWDNVTAGGSEGGGSSEEIVVDGTTDEINVSSNITQGVKHYVVSLSNTIKSAILRLLGLYENVAISLESKADKVQGAMTGNLAALDSEGNLTDSGSKVSDFKTKQTAVPDPSASGTGLEFISSVSQNANGEITASKKSIQDGTTAQKGVLQLQDSVGTTESSTDKAVTPHAVRVAIDAAVASAYHAAGTKTIAQLTSSLLVSANEGNVYNVTDSGTTTADFVEGAGHPINAGDNVGVCDVGGGVYKFDLLSGFVDLGDYLIKTGDASNTTATFTIASSRTNISSGEKLSTIFGKIAKWFSDLKAVAFSGSYTDLSDKPSIPAAANNGVLTIKQNSTSVGTFSANQSGNTEINLTDTTYESKSEASGGTAVSLVTTGEKYTWNHKQSALPTTGTPSDTYAINISGTANNANSLNNVLVCSSFEIGSSFGKVGIVNFGSEGKGRIFLEIHVCRNLKEDNSVIIAEFGSDHENVLGEARILNPSCPYNVYYKSTGNTYEYEVWVCDDAITGGGTRRGSVIADVSKVSAWTPVSNVSPSTRPSGLTQFSTWHVAMTQNGAGSSRLPVYVDADGTFNPMKVDEYYCWAQPTPQWTDVMEMVVWYVQNQCNNEILGSTRNINLNTTHPSLCYLHVKLPTLEGAGRYRFTLEFEITNSSGQNSTEAYGVLILDPPTGYSGEAFLAECVYDSGVKAQSSVMNQIHIPPQGATYRHKLYVDGHTYRVVKTK